MSKFNPSIQMDWVVASLRWLTFLALAISIAIENGFDALVAAVLIAAAIWNVLLTIFSTFNRRMKVFRLSSVAGDLALALIVFQIADGNSGSLAWTGVLPVTSAAIYFYFRGALLVSFLTAAAQAALIWLSALPDTAFFFVLIFAPVYFGLGIFLSLLSKRLTIQRSSKRASGSSGEIQSIDQRRSILELLSALSATLNFERVVETALDLSNQILSNSDKPVDGLVSAAMLFFENEAHEHELKVSTARRFTPADQRLRLPGESGIIGEAIDTIKPRLTLEPDKDPELSRIIALHACHSTYCLPLRAGIDVCGVLIFAHPEAEFFNPERQQMLDLIGDQATIALENARLYQDLEREKERMIEIHEDAHRKLARELHDGPTQALAAIAMQASYARSLLERDIKAVAGELYSIEDLARRTTQEIRHMLFTMRPLVLESDGLIAALQSMADKTRETYHQDVIIQADPEIEAALEVNKQTVIFYIAEEAVNNARKHARADHIWVRLRGLKGGMALLEIKDDGVGFDVASVEASYDKRGSLGMVNLRERAELVNGLLHLDSAPGKGTSIQLAIPLTNEAAERIRSGR